MVNCKLCGKSFKNTQGLSGHMGLKHGVKKEASSVKLQEPPIDVQPDEASAEQAESAAEKRIRYIERALGITEGAWQIGLIERALGRAEPLLRENELSKLRNQVAELIEQLNKQNERLEQLSASTESRRVELAAALELVEKLEVNLNDLRQNVSKIVPWVEKTFSDVTSDLDLLFQAFDCHRHTGRGTCSLSTSPSAIEAFDRRIDLANSRRGKLPVIVARVADQLFYNDKPNDGENYTLYKGVGWALAKE